MLDLSSEEFWSDLAMYILSFGLVVYGIKALITKRITLQSKYLSRAELHTGESAVIWGIIFTLLGIFLFWVTQNDPTIEELKVGLILEPLIRIAEVINNYLNM